MIDLLTPKGRIMAAALECAARKSWADVTMRDIGEAAKLELAELRQHYAGKSQILAALVRAVDDEVLKRTPAPAEGQDRRDALFDIIMTRFDVLTPYRAALKSIHAAGGADVALAGSLLASQRWMLEAAGIGTDGTGGPLRVSGLAVIYASVFRVWLEDDDPGLARTMAALDRRLRRGERAIRSAEQVGSVLYRVGTEGPAFLRAMLAGGRRRAANADGEEANPGTGA